MKKDKSQNFIDNILEYLHQLHNQFPNEVIYLELLALTYYEAADYSMADKYCECILAIDSDNKNVQELKSKIQKSKA
ncbi:MAG: hypothetical protein LBD45_06625 [Bacteroidales bacterium]|jgi:predicted Zn-dependent protease|nr:hypothetical protein [Bacteroidales bacterium]